MAWKRKVKEEKEKVVDVKEDGFDVTVDPRVQQFRSKEEKEVAAAVSGFKPDPEPKVAAAVISPKPDPAVEPEPKDDEWVTVVLKVPMRFDMYKRLQQVGEKRGYTDEGDVVRDGLRRVLW
jgi:hypothetical protein